MRIIIAALLVTLLAACSTSPVRPQDAQPVPADRMFITRAPAADDGIVIVVRDEGLAGSGCGIDVLLDGKPAAFIGSGEKATFPAIAGQHMLTMQPSASGLCKFGRERQKRSLTFTAEAGKTISFRIGISGSGDPVFYQSSL
jgi:hypothetical protein